MIVPKILALGCIAIFLTRAADAASSRSERKETRQLNLQQAELAQQQNDSGRIASIIDRSSPGAPPAAAPTGAMQVTAISPMPQSAPLTSIANPPSKIAQANVTDSSGRTVGAVQRVETSPGGTPTRVDVALLGTPVHIVSLDAATLSYDAQSNVITVQASVRQLQAMPKN